MWFGLVDIPSLVIAYDSMLLTTSTLVPSCSCLFLLVCLSSFCLLPLLSFFSCLFSSYPFFLPTSTHRCRMGWYHATNILNGECPSAYLSDVVRSSIFTVHFSWSFHPLLRAFSEALPCAPHYFFILDYWHLHLQYTLTNLFVFSLYLPLFTSACIAPSLTIFSLLRHRLSRGS